LFSWSLCHEQRVDWFCAQLLCDPAYMGGAKINIKEILRADDDDIRLITVLFAIC
jgi:hypothetical protein